MGKELILDQKIVDDLQEAKVLKINSQEYFRSDYAMEAVNAYLNDMIEKGYLKPQHLPSCNLSQNWDEARQAFSETPQKFRDASYYEAVQEMEARAKTCSCGLDKAILNH